MKACCWITWSISGVFLAITWKHADPREVNGKERPVPWREGGWLVAIPPWWSLGKASTCVGGNYDAVWPPKGWCPFACPGKIAPRLLMAGCSGTGIWFPLFRKLHNELSPALGTIYSGMVRAGVPLIATHPSALAESSCRSLTWQQKLQKFVIFSSSLLLCIRALQWVAATVHPAMAMGLLLFLRSNPVDLLPSRVRRGLSMWQKRKSCLFWSGTRDATVRRYFHEVWESDWMVTFEQMTFYWSGPCAAVILQSFFFFPFVQWNSTKNQK